MIRTCTFVTTHFFSLSTSFSASWSMYRPFTHFWMFGRVHMPRTHVVSRSTCTTARPSTMWVWMDMVEVTQQQHKKYKREEWCYSEVSTQFLSDWSLNLQCRTGLMKQSELREGLRLVNMYFLSRTYFKVLQSSLQAKVLRSHTAAYKTE